MLWESSGNRWHYKGKATTRNLRGLWIRNLRRNHRTRTSGRFCRDTRPHRDSLSRRRRSQRVPYQSPRPSVWWRNPLPRGITAGRIPRCSYAWRQVGDPHLSHTMILLILLAWLAWWRVRRWWAVGLAVQSLCGGPEPVNPSCLLWRYRNGLWPTWPYWAGCRHPRQPGSQHTVAETLANRPGSNTFWNWRH